MLVGDLYEEGPKRWPEFTAAVPEHAPRLRAVYGFPLLVEDRPFGAINPYRERRGLLTKREVRQIQRAFETVALITLAALPAYLRRDPAGLPGEHAVIDRSEVYRATGIIMAELGLSQVAAFDRLRARAIEDGRLLEDVADDIVARRLRIFREPPTGDAGH